MFIIPYNRMYYFEMWIIDKGLLYSFIKCKLYLLGSYFITNDSKIYFKIVPLNVSSCFEHVIKSLAIAKQHKSSNSQQANYFVLLSPEILGKAQNRNITCLASNFRKQEKLAVATSLL